MAGEIGIGLLGVGLGLGLRHGIDWDHIAAITDVTAAQPSRLRGLAMGTLYAGGHAAVVVALGLAAIWAGSRLPDRFDSYMEVIVGVTLISLGFWVFWSLFRSPDKFMLRSRWMLAFSAVKGAYRWLLFKASGKRREPRPARSRAYGAVASTGIGVVHGIGAETGSQALLLAAAAGATSAVAGSFLLAAFAVGLVISNSAITLAATTGLLGARMKRSSYIAVGVLFGAFSIVVGALFIAQRGGLLPEFLA